jgi:hypothetical protein
MNPDIELHIEELILHGFDPRDGEAIRGAVQLELTQLLTQRGLPLKDNVDLTRLDAGTLTLHDTRAQGVGSQVAQSVYQSLGGNTEGKRGER